MADPAARLLDELPESQHLVGTQVAHLSGTQSAQHDRSDAYADEPAHRQVDRLEEATHLSFPPLGHHQGHLSAVTASVDDPHRLRARRPVVELDPSPERAEMLRRRRSRDLDEYSFSTS